MRVIWLLCLLLLSLKSSSAIEWNVCEGVDPRSISEVVLKPDPPSPGVTVDFAIKGTTGKFNRYNALILYLLDHNMAPIADQIPFRTASRRELPFPALICSLPLRKIVLRTYDPGNRPCESIRRKVLV